MDSKQLFTSARVFIVAGKGGVGKTTVTAAAAIAAAKQGLRVLVVELEGRPQLARLLGCEPFTYEPTTSPTLANITGRRLTADAALVDYLASHGLGRVSNRMAKAGVIDIVTAATPGLRDLLVLGKVKQLEAQGGVDVVFVDAPAAGHAISFLRSPKGVLDTVSSGALHTQASEVLAMLGDPARCTVMMVTLPEETPMNELVETAYKLEDDVGLMLGPVVVNGWWPHHDNALVAAEALMNEVATPADRHDAELLVAAARFRQRRHDIQAELLARLTDRLPLPTVTLPYVFTAELGPTDALDLAVELERQLDELPAVTAT